MARRKKQSFVRKLWDWVSKQVRSLVFRVHVLKVVMLLVFFALFAGAYMVHVIYADDYLAFKGLTTTANLRRDVPRGVIYDRYGVPLVRNVPVPVITYRHLPNTSTTKMRAVAKDLVQFVYIEYDFLTLGDKKDLFLFLNQENRDLIDGLTTPAERQYYADDNAAFHQLQMSRVTEAHLATLTSEDFQAHAAFLHMNQGAGMATNIVAQNPTDEEIARVTEHLMHLPGINVERDWKREFPSVLNWHGLLGNVTTQREGIPNERAPYYLSRGHARNARVGMAHLERSLQSYLSGFQHFYFVDADLEESTLLAEGMSGFEVSLNLDAYLQYALEEMVGRRLLDARRNRATSRRTRSAYVVMSNPHTGAVYAMVGIQLDEADGLAIVSNPLGTFQHAYLMGSSVKGASLMVGYYYGYTQVGHVRHDAPIHIQGSNPFRSRSNLGNVSDITALSRSSNVFFYRQVMEMTGNANHRAGNAVFPADPSVWDMYQGFFANLGLGSFTGIELQHENTGFRSIHRQFHELMNLAIGQTDSYTTMQLAQFGGVLATRGRRMQMQLVNSVYMPRTDEQERQLVRGFKPNLMNYVTLTDAQWDNLAAGHWRTVNSSEGTAFHAFRNVPVELSGKTGTAEMFMTELYTNEAGELNQRLIGRDSGNLIQGLNRTFVGYAPSNDPQVVIAAVVPQSAHTGTGMGSQLVNEITEEALEIFFELQASRAR